MYLYVSQMEIIFRLWYNSTLQSTVNVIFTTSVSKCLEFEKEIAELTDKLESVQHLTLILDCNIKTNNSSWTDGIDNGNFSADLNIPGHS